MAQAIELAFKPIWMRQPGESEHMYDAFLEFVNHGQLQGNYVVIARSFGFDTWICSRNHWVQRKNAFWFEAIDSLKGMAIRAAGKLMEERTYTERTVSDRVGGVDGDITTTTEHTKTAQPDARVVIRILDEITKPANDTASGDEISALLEKMVRSTEPGYAPPPEGGLVE